MEFLNWLKGLDWNAIGNIIKSVFDFVLGVLGAVLK